MSCQKLFYEPNCGANLALFFCNGSGFHFIPQRRDRGFHGLCLGVGIQQPDELLQRFVGLRFQAKRLSRATLLHQGFQ